MIGIRDFIGCSDTLQGAFLKITVSMHNIGNFGGFVNYFLNYFFLTISKSMISFKSHKRSVIPASIAGVTLKV